jgi:hypothetical protein
MPGKRLSVVPRRVDTILVAARYQRNNGRLESVRAYERHGDVWSDVVLVEREALARRLESGQVVVTGRLKDMPGDFEILSAVRLVTVDGTFVLEAGVRVGTGDDLGLPVF